MAQGLGFEIPESMKAWVLGDPDELTPVDKPVPSPGVAEVLIRIDAVAICATDLEIISHGTPALIGGALPFNKNFTPGHEFMWTNTRSETGSPSKSMPVADVANAAAWACTRRA